MSPTPTVENVRRSVFPPPIAPLNVKGRPPLQSEWNGSFVAPPIRPRPTLKRKVTPHPELWQPQRMPFEPRHEHIQVVAKPVDAYPPILPASFDTHRQRNPRVVVEDLEANVPVPAATRQPRVVPLLGQLPDNWQLGVAIGVGIGLVLQLVQTSVLKTGQNDIIAKLSGL